VQQQHGDRRHGSQQRQQQHRIGAVQVQIAVAESDVHLEGQPVQRGLVDGERDQHGAVDA